MLISRNTADPAVSLSAAADNDSFKLYLADTGLFVSLLFNSQDRTGNNIYSKLLSDSLDANLGYLYENAAAQILASCGCKLFYHTWKKENSKHSYEIDFLIAAHAKLVPIEIKSSAVNNHKSITAFSEKYSEKVWRKYLFSQRDVGHRE